MTCLQEVNVIKQETVFHSTEKGSSRSGSLPRVESHKNIIIQAPSDITKISPQVREHLNSLIGKSASTSHIQPTNGALTIVNEKSAKKKKKSR